MYDTYILFENKEKFNDKSRYLWKKMPRITKINNSKWNKTGKFLLMEDNSGKLDFENFIGLAIYYAVNIIVFLREDLPTVVQLDKTISWKQGSQKGYIRLI